MYNTIIKSKKINLQTYSFKFTKRIIDIFTCIFLIPLLVLITCMLLFLNFFFNKGKIFFLQKRMGKNCIPFYAIKFRTMKSVDAISRNYSDPIEIDRITKLGRILRKSKVDELPQIINVLSGDMSLIGPRPDYYEHAIKFLKKDPLYRSRHEVRPGITGLAQIRLGYAVGLSATKKKSRIDNFYIKNSSLKLEIKIYFATIYLILQIFYK